MKNYLKMSSACLMMALWPCAWAQHNPLGGLPTVTKKPLLVKNGNQ